MACCRRCCALTRKNMILKARTPISTLLEIVLPLAFVLAMLGLSYLFDTKVTPATDYSNQANTIQPIGVLPARLSRKISAQPWGMSLAVVPGSPDMVAVVDEFLADITAMYPSFNGSTVGGTGFFTPRLRSVYIPSLVSVVRRFDSESSLKDYVERDDYASASSPPIWAAIIFNSGAPHYHYSIAMNGTDVPDTTASSAVNTYFTSYSPNPTNKYLFTSSTTPLPGFLSLQLMLDRFILRKAVPVSDLDTMKVASTFGQQLASLNPSYASDLVSEAAHWQGTNPAQYGVILDEIKGFMAAEARTPQQVDIVAFPVSEYSTNIFYSQILYSLTLLFVIAYAQPVSRLVRGLVLEKELKLRESMLQMGAGTLDLWGSWFVTYAILFAILSGFITAIGVRVFPASSKGLVFLLFYLYSLAAIAWCFLMSVFFTKSRVAAVLGGMFWIASYFPFFGLSNLTPTGVKAAACLLGPTALGTAMEVMANLETNGLGVTAATAATVEVNNWTFSLSLGMLIVDILLYLVLAWYLDQVLPSWAREFGVPRPWYFPVLPSYWSEVCGGGGGQPSPSTHPASSQPKSSPASSPTASKLQRYMQDLDPSLRAAEAGGRCVAVRGLRKEFDTPDGKKVAVDGLDLSFFEGQITCLLGHNGAGKTTAISMLTGLIPPTAGSATIFGLNAFADQATLRHNMGVCPQHDVLWPELTVMEHLQLFAALKNVPAAKVQTEASEALTMVGLTEKANALVSTLSGGMKRKLSVCLAFLGGSKVVFLDEPTSGVDPYSRRSMWNILQNARKGRVIVLTTHFMDEADILGDRIAIMAEGKLRCVGTPLFLKEAFGIGYTATILKTHGAVDAAIVDSVRKFVPEAAVASQAGAELAMRLPLTSSPSIPALLRDLANRSVELCVDTVGMSVTSIESVFLRVAEGEAELESIARSARLANPAHKDAKLPHADDAALVVKRDGEKVASTLNDVRTLARHEMSAFQSFTIHLRATFMKRACVARRDRRAMCYILLVPMILLVVGVALVTSGIRSSYGEYTMTTSQFNSPTQRASRVGGGAASSEPAYPNYVPFTSFAASASSNPDSADAIAVINAIPSANISTDSGALMLDAAEMSAVSDPFAFVTAANNSYPRAAYAQMSAFLLANRHEYAASKYGAYVFTKDGTLDPSQSAGFPTSNATTVGVVVNTTALHAAPIFLNLFNTGLLRRAFGVTGGAGDSPSITVTSKPLPYTDFELERSLGGATFGMAIVMLVTLSWVPAAYAQFIVREREVGAKHQQTISGVSLVSYWFGNWVFDVSTYIIPFSLVLVILAGFKAHDFVDADMDRIGALVLLLLGYGGASVSFTYLESHLFKNPSAASAAVGMFNLIGYAASLAAAILTQVENTCTAAPPMRYALSIFPIYALGDGLFSIALVRALPWMHRQCDAAHGTLQPSYPAYTSMLHVDVAGTALCYLAATSILYLLLAIGVDSVRNNVSVRKMLSRWASSFAKYFSCCRKCRISPHAQPPIITSASAPTTAVSGYNAEPEDADVAAEAQRIDATYPSSPVDAEAGAGLPLASHGAADDVIALKHLRKVYGSSKVAVRDLSFGVPIGQVFGFLGINGAGKTSTLAMLTGDTVPTSGTAKLAGYDIITQQTQVRRLLGYCPQFDALLDLLTVTEHLQLYARIKGISEKDMAAVVATSIADFDLKPYAHKLAGSLSGGNKRKLSVAIALIGSPPLVFLDESSTGVDPVARRKLWNIISKVANEQKLCSIVLTTHSMEEAEALCTRVGIMVGGRLRCLGPVSHLRNVHGNGFSSELRLPEANAAAVAAIEQQLAALEGVKSTAGQFIPKTSIKAACQLLGNADRAHQVDAHGSGWAIHAAFASGPVSLTTFATWWVDEDLAEAVIADFTTRAFPGATVRERQGATLKLHIGAAAAAGRPLADLFETLEALRMKHGLVSSTLSQTTLEEVFNSMAAKQEEEQGKARGFA